MGFENLSTAVDPGAALAPMTPEQLAFDKEKLADATALGLVINDVGMAERHLNTKARPQEWNDLDNLFRAYVTPKNWPNSDQVRAHLGMPLVLEVTESLLPQIHLGFFSDKTPFSLTAKGRTTQKAARAAGKVEEWCTKEAAFEEAIRKIEKSCVFYGTGIGKWGWAKETRRVRKYTKGADGRVGRDLDATEELSHPTMDYCDLRFTLVDPSVRTPDIRDAKYVIQQFFISANELDEMRDDSRYKNIPTRAQLKEILAPATSEPTTDSLSASKVTNFRPLQAEFPHLATSADPLQQPLELLEYWTEDRVIVVLQRKIVIRNDENEYDQIPFVSCSFVDVPGSFYGLGIGKLLEGEQILQQGVVNAWIDSLNLTLNPSFTEQKGVGPSQQNITVAPGKINKVSGEIAPIAIPSVTVEALQAIATSEARGRRRVGANFGPDMPTQAMRTAEGVNEFTSGIQIRTQYFIGMFASFVFVPTLEAFLCMVKDNLTPAQIDEILVDADAEAFEDDHLQFYNGRYNIQVLTSTKLAGKRALVSLVPTLMQLFSAQPVQQALLSQKKKIDLGEFLEQVIDLAGYDMPDVIIDATDEDMQRAMQMNPVAIKSQSDMALQNQKAQDDQALESTKGDVRGGLQVIKHTLEMSGKQDEAQHPNFWPYNKQKPEEPLATRGSK